MALRNADRETYELEHQLDNDERHAELLERIIAQLDRIASALEQRVS